jgi:hypothetical protein
MFNEYGVHQIMKLRQEEIERNAQNAWKFEQFQKESLFLKLLKGFKSRRKTATVKTNCKCVCC